MKRSHRTHIALLDENSLSKWSNMPKLEKFKDVMISAATECYRWLLEHEVSLMVLPSKGDLTISLWTSEDDELNQTSLLKLIEDILNNENLNERANTAKEFSTALRRLADRLH